MESPNRPDIETNPLLDADSYKYGHYLQDPPNCTLKTYYLEARNGGDHDYSVVFGIFPVLYKMFGTRLTHEHVDQAGKIIEEHGEPFNWSGFHSMVTNYGGRWPLRVEAVPEGTVIKTGNILVKVTNTDILYPWLGGFVETAIMRMWYPTTVSTRSHILKGIIRKALELTADNPEAELPYKLHDFGSRGATCREAAAIGGAAHLVNFKGTDTVPALGFIRKYYGDGGEIAGRSIPAAEHSTILSWGPKGEYLAFENMLRQFAKPGGIVAVVSDTYNLWHAIDELWGERLRDAIINSGATVVIRPDSGVPEDVVVEALKRLEAKFGSKPNSKGYKVLNHVRVIQGDGITIESLPVIIDAVIKAGFSLTNLAFGMGGGLLQKLDRDTLRFAMKLCLVTSNGETIGVNKSPIDAPWKASKAGDLDLILRGGKYQTIDRRDPTTYMGPDGERLTDTASQLQLVMDQNGFVTPPDIDLIRIRANREVR